MKMQVKIYNLSQKLQKVVYYTLKIVLIYVEFEWTYNAMSKICPGLLKGWQ